VGCCSPNNSEIYVYALHGAQPASLWECGWDGHAWHWKKLSGPGRKRKVCRGHRHQAYAQKRVVLWCTSVGDDHVWLVSGSDSARQWHDLGTPGSGKVVLIYSAVVVDGHPCVFVRGSDEHVWMNTWDGNSGKWSDLG
jgi:hypothetical protein